MATSYYSPQPLPYQQLTPGTATNPIGYVNTNDPRKLAANQRQMIAGQGDALIANDQNLANQYLQQSQGTQSYLNPIESTLAQGGGGYNPAETAQIELSPEEKQNIISSAGISAGAPTAAAVGAADRAAAASGGNPMALATYRARAAQQMGSGAANALTQARTGAKSLEQNAAETVGGARIGQQNQGLNYYGGLQGQQTQSGLTEQGLAQGAYGTQVGGTNSAADIGLKASQTPGLSDKIIGGISGAASALHLEDGSPYDYMGNDTGMDAVVGEGHKPEAIVSAASAPRGHFPFMEDGGYDTDDPGAPAPAPDPAAPAQAQKPSWMQRSTGILQNYLRNSQRQPQQSAGPERPWNPVDTYSSAGKAIGTLASHLEDGGTGHPPQIFTSPTHVKLAPNDEVVPLTYRPKAKIRPSVALNAMRAAR